MSHSSEKRFRPFGWRAPCRKRRNVRPRRYRVPTDRSTLDHAVAHLDDEWTIFGTCSRRTHLVTELDKSTSRRLHTQKALACVERKREMRNGTGGKTPVATNEKVPRCVCLDDSLPRHLRGKNTRVLFHRATLRTPTAPRPDSSFI